MAPMSFQIQPRNPPGAVEGRGEIDVKMGDELLGVHECARRAKALSNEVSDIFASVCCPTSLTPVRSFRVGLR